MEAGAPGTSGPDGRREDHRNPGDTPRRPWSRAADEATPRRERPLHTAADVPLADPGRAPRRRGPVVVAHGLALPGAVRVAPDADTLYDDLAAVLMGMALRDVGARGVFHLALSGGSTPEPFYVRLVTDPRFRAIPWESTHVWLVDERRVPEDDAKSNYRMIRETLLDHIPGRKRLRHPVPTRLEHPAKAYEEELAAAMGVTRPPGQPGDLTAPGASPPPRLDFALLGMGEDGHTASLFPHSPALAERGRWITVNAGPAVTPPDRVTMTYPLLNAARYVAVLVTGAKKAATLRRVDERLRAAGPDPDTLPITGIMPVDGELAWYLDAAAATGEPPPGVA